MKAHEICLGCDYIKVCVQKGNPWKDNKICPTADRMANGNKPTRERLLRDIETPSTDDLIKWPKISHAESVIQLFFLDRKEPREIAQTVMISRSQVYRIIKKYKRIIIENLSKTPKNMRI